LKPLHLKEVTVERLVESEGIGFHPAFLLPESSAPALAAERDWLEPHFFDPESGRFIQSIHTFVIRTRRHTILVDTCVGNDKERPSSRGWHRMDTAWLASLTAMGVAPRAVDFVLCTHLHVDHVGWNTRLENGRWVPPFPNARCLFNRTEYAHWEAAGDMDEAVGYGRTEGCFADSVLPIMEAGQALLVDGDHRLDETLWLEPTPGHSPGHVCVHLEEGESHVVFSGDILHHPVQCAHPEWNSRYCHDPALSRKTRRAFVARHTDAGTTILAAHFAAPTAGRIVSEGDRVRFTV